MPLFKKTKKQSLQQIFRNNVMEEIVQAIENNKYAIYIPIHGKEEDWLLELAEEQSYFTRADHVSENITYYKIWGWEIERC